MQIKQHPFVEAAHFDYIVMFHFMSRSQNYKGEDPRSLSEVHWQRLIDAKSHGILLELPV